jgi:hypothetical protein
MLYLFWRGFCIIRRVIVVRAGLGWRPGIGYVVFMRLGLARFNRRLTNTHEGAIEGCVEYNAIIAPMTCKSFLALKRITIAQLF